MKVFKKIAAILSAAVIAVTAAASMAVTVGADSIANTATAITSGKAVSTILPSCGDTADYKITVKNAGTLKLSIESEMKQAYVDVYDSDGNALSTIANTTTSGKCDSIGTDDHDFWWNSTIEKYKGTVSYSVKAGTYYIRFVRTNSTGNGKLTFTATYPSGTSSSGSSSASNAKVYYIVLYLEKGDRLSLGATITKGAKVTWKSSNTSVASVSSSGKLTAKGKGSAIITAKCGSSSKTIKIIVS